VKSLRLQTILMEIRFVGVSAFALTDQGSALPSRANQTYRGTNPRIRDGDAVGGQPASRSVAQPL
jgi:hypothetical protein